jgi:Protein of unknown function (DUF2855)
MTAFDSLTRLDDLTSTTQVARAVPECPEGGVLLAVEGLALTSNTATYAAAGNQFGYWKFYPAPAGFGRVPTWGIAHVIVSRCEGVAVGQRCYGFLPLSSHVVLMPIRISARGFLDSTPHRKALPSAYNYYVPVDANPYITPGREADCAVLRPLVILSFLLEADLHQHANHGAKVVIASSASSKTALAAAYLAKTRSGGTAHWVGLTSAKNADFVRRTGAYADVVTYDDIERMTVQPATYLDFSGNGDTRTRVHRHFGNELRASVLIGATHWDTLGAGLGAAPGAALGAKAAHVGPKPTMFFAPDVLKARMAEWGDAGLEQRMQDAWQRVLAWTPSWLTIDQPIGAAALQSSINELFKGDIDPSRGIYVRLT